MMKTHLFSTAVSTSQSVTAKSLLKPFQKYIFLLVFMLCSVGVWGQTITITQSSSGITATGYNSGAERTWTQNSVSFGAKAVLAITSPANLQMQASNGVLYNTTPVPGRILSVIITNSSGTNTSTLQCGNTTRLVNSTTGNYTVTGGTSVGVASATGWTSSDFVSTNYTYFAIKRGTGAANWSSVVINYEVLPCTGTPTAGTTDAATNPVVGGGTTVLSLTGATTGVSGLAYQWQSSTTSASAGFSNISGATASTYTASPIAKTWYRCIVTCSGNDGTSTPIEVSLIPCASIPTSKDGSGITSVTVGSATFPVADVPYYDYTLKIPNLTQGSTVASSISFATGYDYNSHIWIDFNDDGIYDNVTEKVYYGLSSSSNPTILTTDFPISASANLGVHTMRIGTADSGQGTTGVPCYSGTYGVTIDLKVNIVAASASPVLTIAGTTAHGSICPSTAASPQTYTITNTGSSAAAGVTVVSDHAEFVVSALSSTTIAGSGGTATYVVTFTPSSAGTKNATITVASTTSGSNSPTSSLTGTGTATVAPITNTAAATAITGNGATLGASAATFGVCPNTTAKGFVISVTSVNALPTVGGSGVTNETIAALGTAVAFTKAVTGLASGINYTFRAYLFDGATYTYGAVQTFTTLTPPANDLCSNATVLVINDPAVSGTLVNSSFSTPFTSGKDVWYKFIPTCNGKFTIDVNFASSTTDIDLDVFTGSCPTTTTATYISHGSSNFETITNTFTSGITYYIRVSAYNTSAESASFTISVNNQISILTQPTDQSVTVGSTASFGVSSPANQTARQWQVLTTDVGAVWTNIPGATGSPYVTPATTIAMNGYKYRAVISNGTCQQIISNEATLTVTVVSSPSDYFKSNTASGSWATPANWQSSPTGLLGSWITATIAPTAAAAKIDILTGNKIQISSSGVTMTKTTVQSGGTLEVITSSSFGVSSAVGNIGLTVESGGIFIANSTSLADTTGNAYGLIKTGGKIVATQNVDSSGFVSAYIEDTVSSLFYFGDKSICEWDNTASMPASTGFTNYFAPYATGNIPIFRFTNTNSSFSFGSNANASNVNAILEVNSPNGFKLQGTSNYNRTFFGGVQGTGVITQNTGSGSGKFVLGDGTNIPTIGGSVTLNVLSAGLQLPNGANVPVGATPIIMSSAENNSINRQGGNLTVDGTLDLTNMRITNTATGGVVVNGTLKTANSGGLYGGGSAVVDGILTLNSNSTIDYNGAVNQVISSAPNYYNITFSGSGTKTPQNATNVNTNGLVTITGSPIVDFTTNNLGLIGANDTKFTMDGGKLIVGTGATQPRMGGDYNLNGGIVEFASGTATSIRTGIFSNPKQYFNVDVSGSNVEVGGKNLIVKNFLKVTKSTAVLTIPSELDANAPYVLTAKNGIQVIAGGQALFKNNAQLMQEVGASNSGNITMDREAKLKFTSVAVRADYNYWSSPVIDQKLLYNSGTAGTSFSPGTPNDRIFRYKESNDTFVGTGDPNFVAGKGYAIRAENAQNGSTYTADGSVKTFQFLGKPNNENITSPPLDWSNATHGYNLIGNPYPSSLDFNKFYADNSTKIWCTAYFWTNNQYTPYQQGNTTLGYTGSNYAIYNGTGGTEAAYQQPSGSSVVPTEYIKTGQGFIVQLKNAGSSLTFTNNARVPGKSPFFNNKNQIEKDRFWLTFTSPSRINNVLLIGYVNGATDDFEKDFDAPLLIEGSDAFYSKLGTEKLAIQGKQYPLINTDVIPIGAKYFEDGIYIISLSSKEGIFAADQQVYLKDKTLNIVANLSEGDYSFTTLKGVDQNRFEIIYKPEAVLANGSSTKEQLAVYQNGQDFVVQSSSKIIDEVEVFDISGRLMQKVKANSTKVLIDGNALVSGVYLLKIKRNKEIISKKIIK